MNLNKVLRFRAYQRLAAAGNVVIFDVPLKDGGTIDILGIKRKKNRFFKTGVVCLTSFAEERMNKRKKLYKHYFDDLIFCSFDKNINDKKVWVFSKQLPIKQVTLYEYQCSSCLGIFYANNNCTACPYCRKEKNFKITYSFTREQFSELKLPRKYEFINGSEISTIKVLKNPKFVEDQYGERRNK